MLEAHSVLDSQLLPKVPLGARQQEKTSSRPRRPSPGVPVGLLQRQQSWCLLEYPRSSSPGSHVGVAERDDHPRVRVGGCLATHQRRGVHCVGGGYERKHDGSHLLMLQRWMLEAKRRTKSGAPGQRGTHRSICFLGQPEGLDQRPRRSWASGGTGSPFVGRGPARTPADLNGTEAESDADRDPLSANALGATIMVPTTVVWRSARTTCAV